MYPGELAVEEPCFHGQRAADAGRTSEGWRRAERAVFAVRLENRCPLPCQRPRAESNGPFLGNSGGFCLPGARPALAQCGPCWEPVYCHL